MEFSNETEKSVTVDEFDLVSFIPSARKTTQNSESGIEAPNSLKQKKEIVGQSTPIVDQRTPEIQRLIKTKTEVQEKLDRAFSEELKELTRALENMLLIDAQETISLLSNSLYRGLQSEAKHDQSKVDSVNLLTSLAEYLGVEHST